MLHLLEQQELAVSELADVLQMPQSSVSRHLKLLAGEGWVVSRRRRNGELLPAWRTASCPRARASSGSSPPARPATGRRWRTTGCAWRAVWRRGAGEGRDFFAGVAGEWERLRTELYGERFTGLAFQALLSPDWVVADLACGSGAAALALAPWVARVVAVDRSPEMLAGGTASRPRRRRTSRFEEGDLERLPIADGACDAALMLLALTQVDEPALAVAEMARIVKPGGRAVIVDLLRHDREDFRRQMGQKRAGFEPRRSRPVSSPRRGFDAVRCSPLPPEPEARGPALLLASGTRAAPRILTPTQEERKRIMTVSTDKASEHQPRLPGGRPHPRRLGPQRNPPRRAGDARPDGGAQGVRREPPARRPAHHGLAPHDDPDRGADRDAARARRRRALGVVQHLLDPGPRRGGDRRRPGRDARESARHPGLRLQG